jgi:hypothetical protein
MGFHVRRLLVLAGMVFLALGQAAPGEDLGAAGQPPQPGKKLGVDRHGDPLPEGAWARLGTVRLRHPFVRCVAFSPDGKLLASGGDNNVHFWDPITGRQLRSCVGHTGPVSSIAFSPDGQLLASGGATTTMSVSGRPARARNFAG